MTRYRYVPEECLWQSALRPDSLSNFILMRDPADDGALVLSYNDIDSHFSTLRKEDAMNLRDAIDDWLRSR